MGIISPILYTNIVFDEYQIQVISSNPSERIIVEGGPGMGKTAVACARVAYLIQQGIEPSNIWLISFTRTAIKEIKSRIDSFLSQDEKYLAKSIRISTIDSHVWRLRYGFDYADSEELFGSYEANIFKIIEMLQENHEGMIDFIEPIEHLIIDEAQDIVGNRNELIFEFVRRLNKNCGVSVFVDSAQAIYGFADNDIYKPSPIIDRLTQEKSLNFKKLFLKTVFRTSSKSLNSIFTDLREIVLDSEIKAKEKIDFIWDYIEEYSDKNIKTLDVKELSDNESTKLLLFRKKNDLYQYSYHLTKEGITHNIRIGGTTPDLSIWIGRIFGLFDKSVIDKYEFFKLWDKRINYNSTTNKEEAWRILLKLCGNRRRKVEINQLKNLLTRTPPPLELTSSNPISSNLTLSTIHASKGREADIVYLFKTAQYHNNNEDAQQEEARVMFVAATRPRYKLKLVSHDAFQFKELTNIKRAKRKVLKLDNGVNYLIQTKFIESDILNTSFVWFKSFDHFNNLTLLKSIHLQTMLPVWLKKVRKVVFITHDNYQNYNIYLLINKVHIYIGKCSSKLNSNLIHTIKGLHNHVEDVTLPKKITTYCVGIKTIIISTENDLKSDNPYLNSNICIVPIFSTFFEFHLLKIKKILPKEDNEDIWEEEIDEDLIIPELIKLASQQDETSIYEY